VEILESQGSVNETFAALRGRRQRGIKNRKVVNPDAVPPPINAYTLPCRQCSEEQMEANGAVPVREPEKANRGWRDSETATEDFHADAPYLRHASH
jgi:hypothetical protein